VLALPTLLLSLDLSVLYLALPHLSADLGTTATQMLWITDIYGFMIAGFLITMGTLGDRIGRRRLLLVGATAFAGASVLAAYAPSPEALIAARALLGIAGATQMPSTLALIRTMFRDPHQRAVAISVWMSCFMGGTIIGPLVGGLLLERFWWGSVFLLGVPVMVLLLAAAPAVLPESRDPHAGRLDLTSVLLALTTVLPVVYGLKVLAADGWRTTAVAAVLVGVAMGVLFVRRQHRLDDPMLDLTLFRERAFSIGLSVNLGGAVVMSGTFLLLTQYLQLVQGLSPLLAGLWTIPMQVAMVISSILTPHLARRWRPGWVMSGGMGLAALGLLILSQTPSSDGLGALVIGFSFATVGIAAPTALVVGLILGAAPPEKAGAASGMSETAGELGVALGVALLGSVATAVYRGQVVVPEALSDQAAAVARQGLSNAVTAARTLPDALATELIESARTAFTSGMGVVATIGAVLLAALAVVMGVAFRHLPPHGEESTPATEEATEETGEARPDVVPAGPEAQTDQ
jgi:DHA2 family multidrug resistance protein-like MFS transporter